MFAFTCPNDSLNANSWGINLLCEFMDSKRWVFICVWINVCFDSWETYCKKERILGNKHSLILTHYNNIDINFPTQSKAFKIAPWNCKQGPAEPCSNLLRYSRWLKAWVCHQDCCNAFLHQTSLQLAMITVTSVSVNPRENIGIGFSEFYVYI